jgi:hypothetical protein
LLRDRLNGGSGISEQRHVWSMMDAEGGGVGIDLDETAVCQYLPEVGGPLVQFRSNGKNEVAMLEGAHCPAISKTAANPGVERVTGK